MFLAFAGPLLAECNDNQTRLIPVRNNPVLTVSGHKIEDFIPAGWKLVESTSDDFNRDKLNDIAITIVKNNANNILKNECRPGAEELDTNPYAVLVALQQKDASYKLVASDFEIIPRLEDPVFDQPYGGITSKNGVLSISYHFWQSAGSWSTSDHTYKFRYQNNCMRLIGHEYHWLHRGSGEESGTSSNFINSTYIIYSKNPDNKRFSRHKAKLKKNPPYCLGKIPKEFDHIKY